MSINLISFQPNLGLQKPKEQKCDLTSFTGSSTSRLQSHPIQDSKKVYHIQSQQMKHNALYNLSFKGKIYTTEVEILDYPVLGRYSHGEPILGREKVKKILIRPCYKPDCWENIGKPINGENSKRMFGDCYFYYNPYDGVDTHKQWSYSSNEYLGQFHIIDPSFTREESLFRIVEEEQRKLKINVERAEKMRKYAEGGNFFERIRKKINGVKRFYIKEANEEEKYAQEHRDKAKWAEGEANTLKSEREKGALIDISVRNIENPDKPLEQFLQKFENNRTDWQWVEEKLIALPHETMKVADAVLGALGHNLSQIMPLETPTKQQLIESAISKNDFVENVLKGIGKVITRKL